MTLFDSQVIKSAHIIPVAAVSTAKQMSTNTRAVTAKLIPVTTTPVPGLTIPTVPALSQQSTHIAGSATRGSLLPLRVFGWLVTAILIATLLPEFAGLLLAA